MEAELRAEIQNKKNAESLTSTLGFEKRQLLQQISGLEDEIEDLGSKLDMASQNGNDHEMSMLSVGNGNGPRSSTASHHLPAGR